MTTQFSTASANDPRRMNLLMRLCERFVIGKHRMNRICVLTKNIEQIFIDNFKNNSWDKGDERNNTEYLEQEIEIWKADYQATAAKMPKD